MIIRAASGEEVPTMCDNTGSVRAFPWFSCGRNAPQNQNIWIQLKSFFSFCVFLTLESLKNIYTNSWGMGGGGGVVTIYCKESIVMLSLFSQFFSVCSSLFLSLSLSLSLSLFLSVSVCLSVSLSVCLSMSLPVSVSFCLSLSLCLSLPLSLSLSLFLSLCLPLCLCLSVCLCVCLSVYLSASMQKQKIFFLLTIWQQQPSLNNGLQ